MAKFRKKPVVIDAWQFDGSWDSASPILKLINDDESAWCDDGTLVIVTLEGPMQANAGDWIIKGIAGEFYPCKPDIFTATYEAA